MNEEKLRKILEGHLHWLNEDCDGWEGMRANLIGADLIDADLRDADLRGANLIGADLIDANLIDANLIDADLRDADLRGANLRGADLIDANLRGANLRGANLIDADLRGANLRGAKNVPYIPMTCPDTGSFIGWKKCICKSRHCIVKLLIPEDAKRSSATGRKCRASKARVLEVQDMEGNMIDEKAWSVQPHHQLVYEAGAEVVPDGFDEDRFNECSHGIHFFINRQEAVDY